ncbi:MAG: hypothetical protein KBE91_04405 [Bacteroidia bacterium]|nr:hypothetical protein [Bacteroidia bacterium]MBP9688829.1 hypothetical protein [Bacteroidia bacterium]
MLTPRFTLPIRIILLLILCTGFTKLKAQDTLIVKSWLEIKATNRNDDILKFKDLIAAAKAEEIPDAVKHFKKARIYHIIGAIIGMPGAFIFGYTIGYGFTSPKGIDGELLLIGAGLIGVNLTVTAALRDPHMRKGINLYNETLYQKRLKTELDEKDE